MIKPDDLYSTTQEIMHLQGKCLTVSTKLPEDNWQLMMSQDPLYIKRQLALSLANNIINDSLCEFTNMKAPDTYYRTVFARVFITRDDQIRALRMNKVIK